MIPALASFPHEEIEPAFDVIVAEINGEFGSLSLEEDVLEKNDWLATYFQSNFESFGIGRTQFFNLQSVSAVDGL